MDDAQSDQIARDALAYLNSEERRAFVERACAGNPGLREAVERQLRLAAATIIPTTGAVSLVGSLKYADFAHVYDLSSALESRTAQVTTTVQPTPGPRADTEGDHCLRPACLPRHVVRHAGR